MLTILQAAKDAQQSFTQLQPSTQIISTQKAKSSSETERGQADEFESLKTRVLLFLCFYYA